MCVCVLLVVVVAMMAVAVVVAVVAACVCVCVCGGPPSATAGGGWGSLGGYPSIVVSWGGVGCVCVAVWAVLRRVGSCLVSVY